MIALYSAFLASAIALLAALAFSTLIHRNPTGNERMTHISEQIRKGAMAFLAREYKMLGIFVGVVAVVLALALDQADTEIHEGVLTALAFIVGALCSATAGYFGMKTATSANVRTTEAARHGLPKALKIAFNSGATMGLSVVGLGLLGLISMYYLFQQVFSLETGAALDLLTGFALGASSIALFSRVGGGIYTKAADVGADLVGKVEAGIPEDDPRNPAVIADNVGDNVG